MKRVTQFAKEQIRFLKDHIDDYVKKKDEESLHQVRVDVKRIKSILELVRSFNKRFKVHKHYLPFRAIFRDAGKIRDPEIHAGLLLKYNIEGVKEVQKCGTKQDVAHFLRSVKRYKTRIRKTEKKIIAAVKDLRCRDLTSFIKQKDKYVKEVLSDTTRDDEIHKVRKAMKVVIYLSPMSKKPNKKRIKFYRAVEQVIGNLHDSQVVLGLVSNYRKLHHDDAARKLLLAECRSHLHEINNAAKQFYRLDR